MLPAERRELSLTLFAVRHARDTDQHHVRSARAPPTTMSLTRKSKTAPGRYLSLFYWSVGDQISKGVSASDCAVLVAAGLGALFAAVVASAAPTLTSGPPPARLASAYCRARMVVSTPPPG
jgi:hypothetical protein